jgi:hypothetical protein
LPFNSVQEDDQKYLAMANVFLRRNNLYYSDTMDLTSSIHNHFVTKKTNKSKFKNNLDSYIFRETVEKFCWNFKNASRLDSNLLKDIVRPIINGVVTIRNIQSYSEEITYAIVGRKDHRRSGMRFLVRGCDDNGYSANFVETEQIVLHKNSNTNEVDIMAYIQVRGSIPLKWTQDPTLQLNPLIVPHNNQTVNLDTFKKHANELLDSYNKVVVVNLIDKKKDQGRIGECLKEVISEFKTNNPSKLLYNFRYPK